LRKLRHLKAIGLSRRILTQIWIYPVKSLAGIRLPKANVMPKGLRYDRRWMLVDEKGRFLTQREHPEMTVFVLSMKQDGFLIQHKKSKDSVFLPFEGGTSATSSLQVHIWDDEVTAVEVNPSFSDWFSDCLGMGCKLVFFPEENARPVDARYAKNNDQVSLADAYPYLILGEATLADLNEKLMQPLEINRFRPNFVFAGGRAFEEDRWNTFTVGPVAFYGAKPCARCILTTIDPETGIKGIEPLKTLSSYRKRDAKVLFGQNVIGLGQGEVKEGDVIEIVDFKPN
jgi:uncharacterized protein